MKNTNKAFTLVELIVVITILAILGSIAFISLQGYSQEAKNSKVATDLSSISSKINIATSSKDPVILSDLVSGNLANNSVTGTWAWIAISGTTYKVGNVDFASLKENETNFKDPEGNSYIIATLSEGSTALFNVVGQTKDAAGNYKAVIKWNYYEITPAIDVDWLVSASGSTNPLSNDLLLGTNISLY